MEVFNHQKQVYVIAEAGTGHQASLEKAYSLIEKAAQAKADAIKFQHVIADEIVPKNVGVINLPSGKVDIYRKFKDLQVSLDFLKKLKLKCDKLNIDFLCSAFGIQSLADLNALGVCAYKIASPEMNHYALWQSLARNFNTSTKAFVYFSCGVKKISDIKHLIHYLKSNQMMPSSYLTYVLLHCVTEYPALESEYNLWTLKRLEDNLTTLCGSDEAILVGLSDHTTHPYFLPNVACALKAFYHKPFVIEKHFTLDKQSDGLDDKIAIDAEELKCLCAQLRKTHHHFSGLAATVKPTAKQLKGKLKKKFVIKILTEELAKKYDEATYFSARLKASFGDGKKKLSFSEKKNYRTTNRSLLAMKNIIRGERLKLATTLPEISHQNVAYLRSEKNKAPGFNYRHFANVSKWMAKKNIKAGEAISHKNIHAW